MSNVPLRYPEATDVQPTVTVVVKHPDNSETPYDLTGHTITLIRKLTKDVPDNDAGNITSTGTIVVPATNGIFTIPITAAMLTPTGEYWYKINGVVSGKTVTLQYGILEAINT